MAALNLKLLGQMECQWSSNSRLTLPTRKAEVLLAYLALAPGVRHSRERLINLLWSDRSEQQAKNSLRQALSAIKKSLSVMNPSPLEIERITVRLDPDLVRIDAIEFEQLSIESDLESLSKAAALCQGEFLEGIAIRDPASQEWLTHERARFNRLIVDVLSRLSQQLVATGQFKSAIESAERLVTYDSLHETGWRVLMQSYQANGERTQALMAYKRCSDELARELSVEPEPETDKLRDSIRSSDSNTAVVDESISGLAESILKEPDKEPALPVLGKQHSIIILPFDNLSGDPDQEYFSDGITESIILNLSLFPGLTVKSRNSSFAFKQQLKSLGEISTELNVDYVVEGSIRKSVDRVRITVQLIEAGSGNQIWGKRYDSELVDILDLEEELSRTIAATVTGRIESDLQRIALGKDASDQAAYDFLLQGIYHQYKFTRDGTATAQDRLYQCLKRDPDNVRAHAQLYFCHAMDWLERWTEDYEKSFRLAGEHATRALELGPDRIIALVACSEYRLFCREHESAISHVDQALEINPNDPESLCVKGFVQNMTGEFESAYENASACMKLDPYHPWGNWIVAEALLYMGDYHNAIDTIQKIKTSPRHIKAFLVICYLKLGDLGKARSHMQAFLVEAGQSMRSMPATKGEWQQYWFDVTPMKSATLVEQMFEPLLAAGLCKESAQQQQFTDPTSHPSIAVLPFENLSGDPEQAYFSDGITNDIISALSRFRSLRVVARYSTMIYRDRKASVVEIAQQQDVRYVLDGSVRKSGNQVRVSAELIDSTIGENCWVDQYDRNLDDIFAVQDEIAKNIAVAMRVQLTAGEQAREHASGTRNIKAWEFCIEASDLQDSYITDNVIRARQLVKTALELDPDFPWAWVILGWTHWQEVYCGWSASVDESLHEANSAAQKALELNSVNAEAWVLIGCILMMQDEPEPAIEACEKAIVIAPGNAEVQALTALALLYSGLYERAQQYYEASIRLCPVCPNWFSLSAAVYISRWDQWTRP